MVLETLFNALFLLRTESSGWERLEDWSASAIYSPAKCDSAMLCWPCRLLKANDFAIVLASASLFTFSTFSRALVKSITTENRKAKIVLASV